MPEPITHIARETDWKNSKERGGYEHSTVQQRLAEVGFIHCATEEQSLIIANTRYRGLGGLVLLYIDPERLESRLVFEGSGQHLYPHIYGPLNPSAVYQTAPLEITPTGEFVLGTPVPL
jgi:uncharacterized protein (DUF952 family)